MRSDQQCALGYRLLFCWLNSWRRWCALLSIASCLVLPACYISLYVFVQRLKFIWLFCYSYTFFQRAMKKIETNYCCLCVVQAKVFYIWKVGQIPFYRNFNFFRSLFLLFIFIFTSFRLHIYIAYISLADAGVVDSFFFCCCSSCMFHLFSVLLLVDAVVVDTSAWSVA